MVQRCGRDVIASTNAISDGLLKHEFSPVERLLVFWQDLSDSTDLEFKTSFRDSHNKTVAGTMFDPIKGSWAVSTVPVRRFETEEHAIKFYQDNCDPETGTLASRR